MYVRLAFATAIHVDPEILVVDEALAVGDAMFSNRCVRKFEELKQRKITVLFVSHDLGLVKRLSDRAILMMHGRVEAEGSPKDVVNRYVGLVLERQKDTRPEETGLGSSHRHGDGASQITDVQLLNQRGEPCSIVHSGDRITVRMRARFQRAVSDPVIGILIRNRLGIDVFGTNTKLEKKQLGKFGPGEELSIDFGFPCLLTQQEYTLTVAAQYWEGFSQDWLDDVLSFSVVDPKGAVGFLNLETKVEWQKK
jgi:lipopolysaccharide transport system ATP-binding protein